MAKLDLNQEKSKMHGGARPGAGRDPSGAPLLERKRQSPLRRPA
jgi:hypothetical protein